MYTCITLSRASRIALTKLLHDTVAPQLLEDFCFETPTGSPLPHHITLNMGVMDRKLNDPDLLNKETEVVIDAFFLDRELGVCAARVIEAKCGATPVRSKNDHPHITICLVPGTKPVASNCLEWEAANGRYELTAPITLLGTIEECK